MVYSFLQRQCLLCGLTCSQENNSGIFGLCHFCQTSLPHLAASSSCKLCSMPLPESAQHTICGRCIRNPPFFNASCSALAYEKQTLMLIQQLKQHFDKSIARLLCDCFHQQILLHPKGSAMLEKTDLILPAPMFWRRNLKRGNNHSEVLAHILAKSLSIPASCQYIHRCKYTPPQKGLNAKERRMNIQNAFAVKKPLTHMNIAIIDDVMTTGATMNEMSRVLKQAGAKEVYAWSIARTPLPLH